MSEPQALESFRNISDEMLWKEEALAQIDQFVALCQGLGTSGEVVGSHLSKSIRLPVVRVVRGGVAFYLRDNFYDVNLCAVAPAPIQKTLIELLTDVLVPHDWAWYLEQVDRARKYSWRDWTDEQMNDPHLLVRVPDAPECSFDRKSQEEKDRWVRRLTDPSWFTHDWSSGVITCDGEFGPGASLWLQDRPFLQGIQGIVPEAATRPYQKGCTGFAIALPRLELVERLIRKFA